LSAHRRIDSLKTAYQIATYDTARVNILSEIGEIEMIFRITYWDTIVQIGNKNLPYSNPREEIAFLYTKASALNNIGFIHDDQGDIDKAL